MARRFSARFVERLAARRFPIPRAAAFPLAGALPVRDQASALADRIVAGSRFARRTADLRDEAFRRVTDLSGAAERMSKAARPESQPPIYRSEAARPALGQFARLRRQTHSASLNRLRHRAETRHLLRPLDMPPAPMARTPIGARTVPLPPEAAGAADAARLRRAPEDIRLAAPQAGIAPVDETRRRQRLPAAGPRRAAADGHAAKESGEGARPPIGAPDYRQLTPTVLRDTLRRQSGAGAALDFALRERLRVPLKFDPGLARLHRGPSVSEAARVLRAEAFTIGRDVFFAEGRYDPATRAGYALLAHELTHVGQQARLAGDRMRFFTPQGGDSLEEEAQQTASQALATEYERDDRFRIAHQASSRPHPEMAFAMPPPRFSATGQPDPSEMVLRRDGPGDEKPAARKANAYSVADRVYDLMKQEVIRDQERNLARRKV
jgi:hypothetical protein